MRPAAIAIGDKLRLADSTLESTKARLKGCVDRMKELQDRVGQVKRDGLLAVDSVSRRLAAPKYQVYSAKLPCDNLEEIQQNENCISLHKRVQQASKVSDASTSVKLFRFICGCRCRPAISRSMTTTPR